MTKDVPHHLAGNGILRSTRGGHERKALRSIHLQTAPGLCLYTTGRRSKKRSQE